MQYLNNLISLVKHGESSKEIENQQKFEEKMLRLEKEEEERKQILNDHLNNISTYLKTKDYNAVTKYLMVLTNQVIYSNAFWNLEHKADNLTGDFQLFDTFDQAYKGENCSQRYEFDCGDEDIKFFSDPKYKNYHPMRDPKPTYPIKSIPILLNTWNDDKKNEEKMFFLPANLAKINNTNLLHSIYDINNIYYYPLNVILCHGGNHRQFSALIDPASGHYSDVKTLVDLSPLYSDVYFDGSRFRNKEDDSRILGASGDVQRLLGTFFEIGRLLLNEPDYYPDFVRENLNI